MLLSRSLAIRFQQAMRRGCGVVTELTPMSRTPRRMNGATLVGRSMPPASPVAATVPSGNTCEMALAVHGGTHRIDNARPARLRQRLHRTLQLLAVDDRRGSKRFEKRLFPAALWQRRR